MHSYTARVLEKMDNPSRDERPTWNSIKVGVFRVENDQETQVGEYIRNYPSFFNTFYYFKKDDKEYALYSSDYTATRVMELPSCKDLGGEKRDSWGFCPTDFYIPTYIDREHKFGDDRVRRARINNPNADILKPYTHKYTTRDSTTGEEIEVESVYTPLTPLLYYPFGFVAGCIWGDDSTWKVQYLDLSEVEKGTIKRDERFGYIAMLDGQALKDAIDMADYHHDLYDNLDEDEAPCTDIYINIRQKFDLSTGKRQD